MVLTTVTCHECSMQTDLHTEEWPPKVFVCAECSSVFKLTKVNIAGEPIFHLAGYCRFIQ